MKTASVLIGKIWRRLKKYVLQLVASCIGLICITFLFLIEPFYPVRICHIGKLNRFGWLCVFPDHYVRKFSQGLLDTDKTYIYLMYEPDNDFLFKMWARELTVVRNVLVNVIADYAKPLLRKSRFFVYVHEQYDYVGLYTQYLNTSNSSSFQPNTSLSFSQTEEEQGKDFLRQMGLGEDDWFVCFHSRDPAHYDWDYMSNRDSSIRNYLKAAELVTEKGGYAIRMGAAVAEPLPDTGNPQIIDYPVNFRSHFRDIYLLANCQFFLGNTSGIFSCSMIFDRLVGMANTISWDLPAPRSFDPWIPKLIKNSKTNKLLTFNEVTELGFDQIAADDFFRMKELGYEFIENTAEDIEDLCKDMFDLYEGKQISAESRDLQQQFKQRCLSKYDGYEQLPDISPRFILKHQDLLR